MKKIEISNLVNIYFNRNYTNIHYKIHTIRQLHKTKFTEKERDRERTPKINSVSSKTLPYLISIAPQYAKKKENEIK